MLCKKKTACLVTTVVSVLATSSAYSADPNQLGKELTSTGATVEGNKEGTIPAYDGVSAQLPGYAYGKFRGDYFKYKNEKPLYVIDASNVSKYADKLSPGQIKMLKEVKGYTMPVYPTHRSCETPDNVQANTKKNAAEAKIGTNGWTLEGATLPGVPFPIPKSGIEAIWNHLVRYQGVAQEYPVATAYVSPAPGNEKDIVNIYNLWQFWPNSKKGENKPGPDSMYQGLYYGYIQPASLSGQAVVQRFYLSKPTESYYYFTGQRRVRRLPSYDYDAPQLGYENQYAVDQTNILYGAPDRFNWKLVGKKEMLVPYNVFGMYDFRKGLKDVFVQPNVINAAFRRYELHRVWVVEGTVKQGIRHVNPKRVIYLDEDSWVAVGGEDYDAQNQLWKFKESSPAPAWELEGACVIPQVIMYDFNSGRLLTDAIPFGGNKDFRWYSALSPNVPQLKEGYYTSENLQRISDR
ncbi:DUF1329 domain-containing protein [Massilia orientalis]|uniref:DUF1329 domain-containing protein n=1 Tax=Massilia orientalis TaxID=3050128 RepID=A0ACC7MMD3_9BURK|nr:DUF1329 domain-containing protein [Massilia sp. YIM B02787]